jgi:hypothetical protein
MKAQPSAIKVTCAELQSKFNGNEGGYPGQVDSLRRECIYDQPAHAKSRQPPDTRSKLYKYFDGSTPVMWLHCFERPDGTLGGSGRMDPKRLFIRGEYYFCA